MTKIRIEDLCYWAVMSFVSKTCSGCVVTREEDCPIKQYARYGDHDKTSVVVRIDELKSEYGREK